MADETDFGADFKVSRSDLRSRSRLGDHVLDDTLERAQERLRALIAHRDWPRTEPEVQADGLLAHIAPGNVTVHELAVSFEDLRSGRVGANLSTIANARMSTGGQLCPFEIMPTEAAYEPLLKLFEILLLDGYTNINLYKPKIYEGLDVRSLPSIA